MSSEPGAAGQQKRALKRWQVVTVTCLITVIALGLAAYAAAASYESVSALAARKNVPLAWLNPAGIDGGLFGIILADIVLTWAGMPLPWLRFMARLFAIGTVTANAAAGWPDPAGVGLRIAAPTLFVVFTEAGRSVLLRRDRSTHIPVIRWVLAFKQTWAIWKRQKLWEDARLPIAAIEAELAIVKLSAKFGEKWWEQVPADLVWMIRAGVRMAEAVVRVAELTAPPQAEAPGGSEGRKQAEAEAATRAEAGGAATRKRKPQPARKPQRAIRNPDGTATESALADLDREVEAWDLLRANPTMNGSELGRQVGVSTRRGRQLRDLLIKKYGEPKNGRPIGQEAPGQEAGGDVL